jgi:hypothetical protein
MMGVEEAKARLRYLGEEVDAQKASRRQPLISPVLAAGALAMVGGMLLGGRKKGGAKSMVAVMLLGKLLRPAIPVITKAALGGLRNGRVGI